MRWRYWGVLRERSGWVATLASLIWVVTSPPLFASPWDGWRKLSDREMTFLRTVLFEGNETKAVDFVDIGGINVNSIGGEPLSVWFYRLGGPGDGPSRYRSPDVQRIVFGRFRQNPNPPNIGENSLSRFCNYAPFRAPDPRAAMFGTPQERQAQAEIIAQQQKPHVEAMAAGFNSLLQYGLKDKGLITDIFKGCFFNNVAPIGDKFVYDTVIMPMLRAGADINTQNIGGRRPIQDAVEGGNADLVEWLVRDGAQVNFQMAHTGFERPPFNDRCAPARYRSLYYYSSSWAKSKNPDATLRIVTALAGAGLSPMTKLGYWDPKGSGQCLYASFYDTVVDAGNFEFAKQVRAAGENVKVVAAPAANAPQGPKQPAAPATFGDWQSAVRSDGRPYVSVAATSSEKGSGLKEVQIECASSGRLELILVGHGNERFANITPEDVGGDGPETKPFAASNNRIAGAEVQRLLKRLAVEEQQAKQAGARSWTFVFTTGDPNAAGYSAEMGGFSKARDYLQKQCKPATAAGAAPPPR